MTPDEEFEAVGENEDKPEPITDVFNGEVPPWIDRNPPKPGKGKSRKK